MARHLRKTIWGSLIVSILCAVTLAAAAPARPKLVIAIVIDQFRYDYLLRFRDEYKGGLARLLDHGAVFTDAHYPQSFTVTAIGHSTFLSGATPSISGIIGNEWYERSSGKTVTSVSDPGTKLIGGAPGKSGSSPRRLLSSTVGDELRIRNPESRVIGISIKDRASILPSGHMANGAYWYDDDSNQWVTSSFYVDTAPAWVKAVNDSHPSGRTVDAKWMPLNAKSDAKPFCTMTKGTPLRFCGSIEATPWGNELIEEFAEAAVSGENLGKHSAPDLLTVSFSSNDYVGHALGPDSPEVHDMAIRTDLMIGKLLDYIDQHVGLNNALVVLTSDHGVAPLPEVNVPRHMPGGRLVGPDILKAINTALVKKYGPGEWLLPSNANMPYLDENLMLKYQADPAQVERTAADAVEAWPHIARVATHHELDRGEVQRDSIGEAMSKSYFGARSASLFVLQDPFWIFEATGASHGTPYDYDNHVPVIFMGQGIHAGSYSRRVLVNDIAPTLANILQVATPSGSIGQVLREAIE